MDLITQYPLGDDIAVTLLVLAALSVAALVAGAIVPTRLSRDEDAPEVDEHLGKRLGAQLSTIGVVTASIGLPALVLVYLVPGTTDDRILRAAMMLAGLLLGPLAAWRGIALQLSLLGVGPERRLALAPRLGALAVTGALALGVVPTVIAVWFLREGAGAPLVALAAGAALSALVVRVCTAPLDAVGAAASVLVGADENELGLDDEENVGAAHLLTARMVRRGAALAADLVAITSALAAAGLVLGVPVLAAEGVLVVLLGLGVALLAAAAGALIPHRANPGMERMGLRLGGIIPAVLGGAGVVAAAALWLPTRYKELRFAHAGMGNFTDPAVAGPQPLPRDELTPQIEQATQDMSQWISATDETRDAGAFLDVLTLYTVSPSAVVAGALGLGALAALGAVLLLDSTGDRHGGTVLRAARTSRTGGALGTVAAMGSSALVAAGALALVLVVATVISVLSAGVPGLALTLLAHSGLGALVVAVAFTGALAAPAVLDRTGTERALREAAAPAATGPRAALLLAAVFAALAVLGPIVTALQVAPRAASVWEDRALHALTPQALPSLAGIGLGVVTVLLVSAALLDSARRAGANAVVEARASMLAGRSHLYLDDLHPAVRRASLTPVVVAVLMPIVAGFGLGPAALPGYVAGLVLAGAGLGLWALGSSTAMEGAADAIAAGRYGGPGSWGHSGALGGAVLTGVLRSTLGAVAPALLLTGALLSTLAVASVVGMNTDGSSPFLRWGIAVVALVIAGAFWVVSATAPEVDLEDGVEETSRPLFATRADEREDTLDAMSWESDEDERR